MLAIAFALLAIGVADLVAGGLAGWPARDRIARGTLAGGLLLLLLLALTRTPGVLLYAAGTLGGIRLWLTLRSGDVSERRAGQAAGSLVALLAFVVLAAPSTPDGLPDVVDHLFRRSPVRVLARTPPEGLLAVLGVFAVLGATTNGFVRTVLRASGTHVESSEKTLRGGRLIGVLERILIFVLILGGEPTAAALVVSAKSLVRFPELNAARDAPGSGGADEAGSTDGSSGPREIDYVTEYFLLGSMVSWSVAILPAVLLR